MYPFIRASPRIRDLRVLYPRIYNANKFFVPLFMHLCNFRNVCTCFNTELSKKYIFSCVPLLVFKRSPAYKGASSKGPACKLDQIHLKLRCQYYPKEPQL